MAIKLKEIDLSNRKDVKEFAFLPWKIYRNDKTWVPALKLSLLEMLDQKHPFYKTAKVKAWIAESGGEAAGRIMPSSIITITNTTMKKLASSAFLKPFKMMKLPFL